MRSRHERGLIVALALALAAGACATPPDEQGPTSGPQGDPRPGLVPAHGAPGSSDLAPEAHRRADEALETMMLEDWAALRTATNDAYWTYANDWDVALDAVERHDGRWLGTARMFYEVQAARGWSRDFYDDENWMTLALVRAYDLLGDPEYLVRAKALYADIESAWDESCCGDVKGGIWWRKAHDSKVTAINGGAVISGARLYARTGDASYLAFAKKVFGFWSTTMVDPETGHVYDGISSSGEKNTTWTFTYNEGVMIGGAVELARATGDDQYLALAHRIAAFLLAHESAETDLGTILSDGPCGKPGGDDGEQFKGIAARYLALLYEADRSHDEYRAFLERSAEAIWQRARDPVTGRISCDWAGPFDSTRSSVNSLSSAAMTLAVTARILGSPEAADPLTYEVEEGDLSGIGLEASHDGFSGWGYLAGWNGDGQRVDVVLDVPKTATYVVALRYATVDDARRRIDVNGQTVEGALAFPATGAYEEYDEVTVPAVLEAGRNTVSVVFDGSSGGWLNLDRLRLSVSP